MKRVRIFFAAVESANRAWLKQYRKRTTELAKPIRRGEPTAPQSSATE